MQKRDEMSDDMSLEQFTVLMAEGNPGAATVMGAILQKQGEGAYMTLLNLDDMNIRGAQIWYGFKDHCRQDIDDFIAAINSRDEAMVKKVNASAKHDNPAHLAVRSGAMSNGRRMQA